ncbi:PREDICTED: sorting nexin-14-like [Priapulus caudatus]|uniref:Sorting nexin-14-like n=1 Tax=Priapulus caudatus TaxID=37621 RepID=A0ABM1FC60_PRICU|nr:PREDICTED: sorting nexin-14-like [Priapulus caudatus]
MAEEHLPVATNIAGSLLLPNLLFFCERKSKKLSESEQDNLTRICSVCGKNYCIRHRSELSIEATRPWTNVVIPKSIDSSLEQFLDVLLKEYVHPWYSDVSDDEAFVDEVKLNLRFLAAILIRRASKVDLAGVITHKFFPAALRHLDLYIQVREDTRGLDRVDPELTALDYYGKELHCAVRSRTDEMNYLKRIVRHMLPVLALRNHRNSKAISAVLAEMVVSKVLMPAMDIIADPDIVNNLLLIFFNDEPMTVSHEPPSPLVPLLENLILRINKDMRPKVKNALKLNVREILDDQSLLYPFIHFLKGEGAVNTLQFCLSVDDFNKNILNPDLTNDDMGLLFKEAKNIFNTYCAENAPDRISFDPNTVRDLKEILDGSTEDVVKLRTTPPLFKAYEHAYNLLENIYCPMFQHGDDYFKMICGSRIEMKISRSTSSTSLSKFTDGSRTMKKASDTLAAVSKFSNRIKGVFKTSTVDGRVIEVEDYGDLADSLLAKVVNIFPLADDMEDSHWTVERRYNEFYVLEGKLVEFHGPGWLDDLQLPAKRAFGTKTMDFTESKREVFESWLQRGQGLEAFLQLCLQSTEPTRARAQQDQLQRRETMVSATELLTLNRNMVKLRVSYTVYVAVRVFKVPSWLEQVLLAGRVVCKLSMESWFDWYLDQKLRHALGEHHIVALIELLRDAIFFDDSPPRTEVQKTERAQETLKETEAFLPGLLVKLVGEKSNANAAQIIVDCVQHPKLNKQLAYMLADLLLLELFPELSEDVADAGVGHVDKCVQ